MSFMIFFSGQYMTVRVGGGKNEKEQEKQARMPILLPQFNGILQVGLTLSLNGLCNV